MIITFLIRVCSKTITHLWEESGKSKERKIESKKNPFFLLKIDHTNESLRQTFNFELKNFEEKRKNSFKDLIINGRSFEPNKVKSREKEILLFPAWAIIYSIIMRYALVSS